MTDKDIAAIISKNINKYLELQGKDQAELAAELNVSEAAVSTWCNGTKSPRMNRIDDISRFFGVNRSDIIEDNNEANDKIDGVYLSFARDAQNEGIDPEDIKKALAFIRSVKKGE